MNIPLPNRYNLGMVGYDLPETIVDELRRDFLESKGMFQYAVKDARELQVEMDALIEDFLEIADVSVKMATIAVTLLREFD